MSGFQEPDRDTEVVIIIDDVGPPPTTREDLREMFAKLGIDGDEAIDAIARLGDRMAAGMLKLKRCLESQELKQAVRDLMLEGIGIRSASVNRIRNDLAALALQCTPELEETSQPKPRKSRKQQRRLPRWQRDRR